MNRKKIEDYILSELNYDMVSLSEIITEVGIESGTQVNRKGFPSEEDFIETMKFLKDFLERRDDIRVLHGADLKELNMSPDDLIKMLSEKFRNDKYDEINYSIWLDNKIEE